MKQPDMYRVFWKSRITGLCGNSAKPLTKIIAEAWAKKANRDHPQIEHAACACSIELPGNIHAGPFKHDDVLC